MNKELLKKLEDQCYGYAGFRDDTIVFNHEKFAKLIVEECASIDFYQLAHIGTEDDYNVTQVIKRHFGVE